MSQPPPGLAFICALTHTTTTQDPKAIPMSEPITTKLNPFASAKTAAFVGTISAILLILIFADTYLGKNPRPLFGKYLKQPAPMIGGAAPIEE